MWLVPDDSAEVDKIYAAMTQCQTLHPDPNDSFSDDDEGTVGLHRSHLLPFIN